jgi:SAM-dependent methyltransferase
MAIAEIIAYNEAARSGRYEKPAGLLGKYDNVRRFWEDAQVGLYLRPYLERLIHAKKERGEKLHVIDLGCGSGDGFELLMAIDKNIPTAAEHSARLIEPGILGSYKGIDINNVLLEEARGVCGNSSDVSFVQADLNGIDFQSEEAYDLYFANYGTLSHNSDEQTVKLLGTIGRHGRNGTLILVDWLGRYSYEWQTLWTHDLKHNQWMDYAISYLHTPAEEQKQLTYFPLRIVGRREVQAIYRSATGRAGGSLVLRALCDRSSFVGRHVDTAQYNRHCQTWRSRVNSLFEMGIRTNLEELFIRYVPLEGFPRVNAYHERLAECWSHLVAYTVALLSDDPAPNPPNRIPSVLRRGRRTMRAVIQAARDIKTGDPRANLVEPQLAYCLRELEIGLQQGLGCGHGLVAIFEVVK